ncbi:hypothetical protein [Oleomonas cavernae]|nr:hypothetical protein [Oleomonas cavernae]
MTKFLLIFAAAAITLALLKAIVLRATRQPVKHLYRLDGRRWN